MTTVNGTGNALALFMSAKEFVMDRNQHAIGSRKAWAKNQGSSHAACPRSVLEGLENRRLYSSTILSANSDTVTQPVLAQNAVLAATIPVTPSLSVQSPNGGESLLTGGSSTISWVYGSSGIGTINYQNIALSTDGGATFTNIATGLAASTRSLTFLPMSGQVSSS